MKFLQENIVALEMSYQMSPLSSAGKVNASVECLGCLFFFSSSLGSQESHSSRWTSGLWKSHINLAEMMRQPRTRAVCSNAHHSTWPQPIAGHLAPHSGSRISLGPRIFSCLLGFLCLPSDICPFRFLRHPEIPSLLGLWVSQLRERLALSAMRQNI